MPIYEYKCNKCNEEFECLILGSDEEVSCPGCDNEKVDRLMSACSFQSGGSGDFTPSAGTSSSSGCSSCAGGNCSTCH